MHGFLGPNGSGKTTTLRTLLGLVNADSGRMTILGRPAPEALPEVAHRVGAIVESPQFFGNFSARHTLRLLATAGGVPAAAGGRGAGAGRPARPGRRAGEGRTRWA